jgi:pyruvate dehydrogenase E1 component beta subunit
VIVHEACRSGGFGAEIAARIAESGMELLAPLRRVTAPDVIVPYMKLEPLYLPGPDDIVQAVRAVMEEA